MNISRDIFFNKKQIYLKLYQRIKMDNVKICETLTKLDAKGIKKALNEFADFDIEIRNEIFKMQRANFHKLKERHKDCDIANDKEITFLLIFIIILRIIHLSIKL